MKSGAWLSVAGTLFSNRGILADYVANGTRDAIPLAPEDAQGTYAGFAGAALVLPEGRPPLPREQLMGKLLANPTDTMRELFAPRLGSPPVKDATYAQLATKLGRDMLHSAAVAVIDPNFDSNVPKSAAGTSSTTTPIRRRATLSTHCMATPW